MISAENKIPVILIFAPTASGKTALTRELFSKSGSHFILNAEVVSADSMQVYKYLDIGTAKPEKDFCAQIPHHLIDLVEPNQQFTVADFISEADKACEEIYSRGKIPVVCGGTGFYIRNFLYGLPDTPESDEKIRAQLQERITREGNEVLYAELQKIDPESAAAIHVNDAYRICRALEVYYSTGRKRSEFKMNKGLREKYNFLFLVLEPEREVLFERIDQRVEIMFQQGLEEEVKNLIEKGYTKDMPGLKAIGYQEFFDFAEDGIERIKERIQHNSRKYAKKQYTYIRDIPGSIIIPFDASAEKIDIIAEKINDFLRFINYA